MTHRGWTCLLLLLALAPPPAPAGEFAKQVVVAQEGHAADVGRDVLRAGGNAVDAAVATAMALAVTHPAAGNIGGGGFLVAFLAGTREVITIDFREKAPGKSFERMYLDADGHLLPHHRAGPRAAGVPGTVRGLALAVERYGSKPWGELVRPAARLAREGFPVSETLARSLNAQLQPAPKDRPPRDAEDLGDDPDRLADFADSVAAFARADRDPWRAGDLLKQPDLARTLDRLAAAGPDDFYRGATARLIVAHNARHGGLIDLDDLASYRAVARPPIHSTFRGVDLYGMGPPSSGGIVVALALNILERYDLKADGPASPRTLHRVTEAMRRAYFIRATELADPDFVAIPTERLVSQAFADDLARTIRDDGATPGAALAPFPVLGAEGSHTTHLSTVDAAGNAVALTYTLEEGYGSKSVVAGAGFLMNNEMGDFNLIPGRTDAAGRIGTVPNRIAPGRRMLSSMAPTIAVKDGSVVLVTGSPGGRTIPNTVLWVVLNRLEFGLGPAESVTASRTHHAWFPDVLHLEGDRWPAATVAALRGLGHRVRTGGIQGDAHTIVVRPADGRRVGVPDPRRRTAAAAGD
ncbi:MAG TPA: gamma-glutamyltransferase family protein [Isosphaeraceae bacterium]|jgi:gamma-glutamyltranspeptidase/glutathione hydrolase|nr:gamma-glutamyltransferase family protein [Isosphaeraceae bacterium]